MEENQQHYVDLIKSSLNTWTELRRIHGLSGKGKLAHMMQTYNSYAKGADKIIDQMSVMIRRMCDDIKNLTPGMRPADISIATVMMNACHGKAHPEQPRLGRFDPRTGGGTAPRGGAGYLLCAAHCCNRL